MGWPRLLILCLAFCVASAAAAQPEACPTYVAAALSEAGDSCAGIGRNHACYGNLNLSVTPRDENSELDFSEPGDTVALAEIVSMHLAELAPDVPEWGVAVMALQANLPESLPGQNLIMVLFGDVEIEDAFDDSGDIESYGPMQAFVLRTGIGMPACSVAPASGVVIQTPDGAGEVTVEINSIRVSLGSTAVVRAAPGDSLRFTILEGFATLSLDGEDTIVLPFQTAVAPLDADGTPSGEITVEDAQPADWAALPLTLLPREVTTPPAEGGSSPFEQVAALPASDAQVLPGRWAYETTGVDLSQCPGGSGSTGTSGVGIIALNADGTFTLFDVAFSYDGEVWRGEGTQTTTGITANHEYEITFDGEHATAVLTSDIAGSPMGTCTIRWTADMQHLED